MRFLFTLLAVCMMLVGNAEAAISTTGFVIDLAPVEALLAVVVVAMGGLYVIRKFVKTGNRI